MLIQPLLTRLDELNRLSTQGEWHVTKIDFTTRKGEIGVSQNTDELADAMALAALNLRERGII